jgi:hypothetical protein
MGERSCNTCTSDTKAGNQCSRRTCNGGPTCWQHGKSRYFLRVKDSTIPGAGKGLFVDKPGAKPGEVVFTREKKAGNRLPPGIIAPYTPKKEFLSEKELEEKYPGNRLATYAFTIHDKGSTYAADPEKTNDGYARFPNDASRGGQGKKNKVDIETFVNGKVVRNKKTYDVPRVSNPNPKILDGKFKPKKDVAMPYLTLLPGNTLRQGEEIFADYGEGYWKSKNGHLKRKEAPTATKSSSRSERYKKRSRKK